MKYIKKPVVVEAFQYNGYMIDNYGRYCVPKWALDALVDRILYTKENGKELHINTLEGDMRVSIGDFIIKGVNGEIYPCKPDIFKKTYDEYENDSEILEEKNNKKSKYSCKKCNSSNLGIRTNSKNKNAKDLYCKDCGAWIKFANKDDCRLYE